MDETRPIRVILDDARPGRHHLRVFERPARIIRADAPEEVADALGSIATEQAAGRHVAGYFSYELGYALEPKLAPLMPVHRAVPLLWFGVFERAEDVTDPAGWFAAHAAGRAYTGPLAHDWRAEDYAPRFARTHAYIEAGDIYQANLSFRSRFAFAGDPLALYRDLRGRAAGAHCAFVDDGTHQILSLSPELFFDLTADGALTAKPMKGTSPRGTDAADDARAKAALQASAKDRAENLMIVDLLRNDLGRIAVTGSVSVENLFTVETYPTLHTMVSTVRARLRPGSDAGAIVRALFPCGSVTGAPKIRAMEIINALEQSPRGVYCGAIGHFAPDGAARFNVAIRTLTISGAIAGARGELGIGGAVVHDSTNASEYAECLLKARYFENARKPIGLIETLRWSPDDGFVRGALHLERMEQSAAALGLLFDRDAAQTAMDNAVRGAGGAQRVRLTLDEAGVFACTTAPLTETQSWRYVVSPLRLSSGDALARHKNNWREIYEGELARLSAETGCDEVLFLNECGELVESARANLFVRISGVLFTPPLSSGPLPGCLRRELLARGECAERVLTLDDLDRADAVYFGNSLRGLVLALASLSAA